LPVVVQQLHMRRSKWANLDGLVGHMPSKLRLVPPCLAVGQADARSSVSLLTFLSLSLLAQRRLPRCATSNPADSSCPFSILTMLCVPSRPNVCAWNCTNGPPGMSVGGKSMRYGHLQQVPQLSDGELAIVKKAQRDVRARDLAGHLIWSKAREIRTAFWRVHGRAAVASDSRLSID